MSDIHQTIKAGAESICPSCAHYPVCRAVDNQICTECNQYMPTVRHGRCPVCSGQEVLAQDCDNGYSVEIDAESQEMTLWNGDTCLAAISVDYCPVCGSRMDGAE